jgi:hypothetical protein
MLTQRRCCRQGQKSRLFLPLARVTSPEAIVRMISNHAPDTTTGMMARRTHLCVIPRIWSALSCVIRGLLNTVGLKQMDRFAGMCTPHAQHGMELRSAQPERNIVLAKTNQNPVGQTFHQCLRSEVGAQAIWTGALNQRHMDVALTRSGVLGQIKTAQGSAIHKEMLVPGILSIVRTQLPKCALAITTTWMAHR